MTDLFDEVKASFHKAQEVDGATGDSPVTFHFGDPDLAPGFVAAHEYYKEALLVITRRGYRHFAGSSMSTDSDVLLTKTTEQMLEPLIALTLLAFADGVMIGQRSDQVVKMCFHFDNVEHAFHDQDFRTSSKQMARGFSEDAEVREFFLSYITRGLSYISHLTGFVHSDSVNPGKVWDIWMMTGTATTAAAYLAGHTMGSVWRERDVLDGIEIATEEGSRGSEGADGSDL